jgi:hypothetical protein
MKREKLLNLFNKILITYSGIQLGYESVTVREIMLSKIRKLSFLLSGCPDSKRETIKGISTGRI